MTEQAVIDRLARTFATVAAEVPSTPPTAWVTVRDIKPIPEPAGLERLWNGIRRHKVWTLSLAFVIGAGGAGLAAAASGVFSSQADKAFRTQYAIPLPAAFGQIPAFNPAKERLEVTDPGPEHTTLSVWTYAESADIFCVAVVESNPGKPTFPGKPPERVPAGGCTGHLPGTSEGQGQATPSGTTPHYGRFGGIWRGSSGTAYWIVAGSAPNGAIRVVLHLPSGSQQSAEVHNGWYAFGVPYGQNFGITGTFYSSSGSALAGGIVG